MNSLPKARESEKSRKGGRRISECQPALRKLAIFATHPIQYQVPWYRELERSGQVDLSVYFGMIPGAHVQGEGFDVPFEWDIPLLEGYRWQQLRNSRPDPRLDRFLGSSTPDVGREMCQANGRPDVAIVTGWHALPMFQALVACRRRRIPCLVRGESNALRERPLAARLFHRLILSQFRGFLTIGKSNSAFYSAYGIPTERMFSVPYFVENARFRRQADEARPLRNDLRRKWQIPEDAVCFVFAGKFQSKKRPLDLLRAMSLLQGNPETRGKAHLLMAGTGRLMEESRAFASAQDLPVTFAGFLNQTEITDAYTAADCSVLPSDTGETWGLVVNEAMACGLPALVSDQVGCREDLILEGRTGWSHPCGNVELLADRMKDIARKSLPELRESGRAAQEHIEHYSPTVAARGTLEAVSAITASAN